MNRYAGHLARILVAGLFLAFAAARGSESKTAPVALDAASIGKISGAEAKTAPDGVVRIAWSRTDVPVMVDGSRLSPAAGLGSWAAFSATKRGAIVMGDTVVFQDEVDAAMDAAFAHGLSVTGLHNHFFYDTPKVYFMHIGGEGAAGDLATGVKAVWDAIRKVRKDRPVPASSFGGPAPIAGDLDAAGIEKIVGHPAPKTDGVAKVTIGREGRREERVVGASMGLTTWAAFSGSDAAATIDGDFIMTAAEVQPTLRALRHAGLHVVALHNHMIDGTPDLYFTHFWGSGSVRDLATGFRQALDSTTREGAGVRH